MASNYTVPILRVLFPAEFPAVVSFQQFECNSFSKYYYNLEHGMPGISPFESFKSLSVSRQAFLHLIQQVIICIKCLGLLVEIINIIAEHLNSTVIAESYTEVGAEAGFQIGSVGKGNVTGLMGQVYNGNADTIAQ